jgi:hypothetical protein
MPSGYLCALSLKRKKALFICITPRSWSAGTRAYHHYCLHCRPELHVQQHAKAEPTLYLIILHQMTEVGGGGSDATRGSEMLADEAEVQSHTRAFSA